MNVFQNMIELYNHLSPGSTYRYALREILTHLQEASESSIYELSDLSSASRTTIWRMLQMLGYENYAGFRGALKQAIENYTYYNRILSSKAVDDAFLVDHLADHLENTAQTVRETLSVSELSVMAQHVAEKQQVYFFFPYRSAAIYSFQQNLAMAGIGTEIACLLPEMLECAEQAESNAIAFCTTIEYAETMNMTRLFQLLKEKGAEIAMFLSGSSRYDRYIDYPLCKKEAGTDALSNLTLFDMYLYGLSEIFRNHYLTERE